ncbi:MAG: hypothetical protein JW863_18270 [Chitinispirillaceae bacterium]|nr:hypothetical protein [Chitinispirillaceae bacterium]
MQVSIDSLFNSDGTVIPSTSASAAEEKSGSDLDKSDFLELLCTQLKYQDPLNPQTDTDMAAQLAQYSSLELMQNIESAINNQTEVFNSAVSALQYSALSSTNASSISLIGKTVRLQQTTVTFDGYEDEMQFRINLGDTASTTVTLLDEEGETVRTFSTGDKDADDTVLLTWDGLSDQGEQCAAGDYTIAIEGEDSNSSLYCFVEGEVSGIRFNSDGPAVIIDGEELTVSNILAVT